MITKALVESIQRWQHRNFEHTTTELSVFGGLVEETGEVMRAAVKRSQGIRGTSDEWAAEIRKEVGDTFIKLCDVARYEGFDLVDVILERWNDISQRDWTKDKKGHGIEPDEA